MLDMMISFEMVSTLRDDCCLQLWSEHEGFLQIFIECFGLCCVIFTGCILSVYPLEKKAKHLDRQNEKSRAKEQSPDCERNALSMTSIV